MKVILQKPVDKLGVPGDIVEVADGYARNYLMPRGLAVKATQGGVRHIESLTRAHTVRVNQAKSEAEQVASRLTSTPITVRAHAGEEGRLFGSVTPSEIAEEIHRQAGVRVDRHDVHPDEPIRSVGVHEVRVHLFAEVDPIISVQVEPDESS
ncbi:MAG TPA: 50S ribosomal protein L9 [Actinomycetota bacterium]|jgi:large subunit ribosomal protein L9|nr:50S ribosomal protein L9 [Actinomycetota bacterium]